MNENHDLRKPMHPAGSTIRKMAYLVCFLMLLCSFTRTVVAQGISVNAAVDKNTILIGEPIRMLLEARLPDGTNATWFSFDSIPHFEFVEKAKIDTVQKDNGVFVRQTVTITSFDSGRWVIPSMEMEINGRTYLTDSFPVAVNFSAFDPAADYHDIKDILEVANPYSKYITWAVAAVTLLSLIAVIYFLRRRTVTVIPPPVHLPASVLSPFEEAMQLLGQLKQQQLYERGEVKMYYTRLNDILRAYLLREMALATMQKTNEELIVQVAHTRLPHDSVIALAQALRMSDAVKFARFIPGAADSNNTFNTIRSSVEQLNNLQR